MESLLSTIQVECKQWTDNPLSTQKQLEKNKPPSPPTTKEKGGTFIP
jgi:hypothetical protein